MNDKKNEKSNVTLESKNDFFEKQKLFFDQWLKRGDLKLIADKLDKSYTVVRKVRLNPAISKLISNAICEVCLQNKLQMEANLKIDMETINMVMRIDDNELRLGLWNKLTGGQKDE